MTYCRFKSMNEVKVGSLINFKTYRAGRIPIEEWENGLIVDFNLPANLSSVHWNIELYPCYKILLYETTVWLSFKEIKYTSAAIWKQLKE